MKLIFLLGNIGSEYRGTRHNIAWDIIDGASLDWAEQGRFKAYTASRGGGDDKVIYARPTTFYNLAGQSLRAIMDFYKIERQDVLVIHDDLMLPIGTIRARVGGRDAGNNGLKSIAQYVGQDLARIRIGIANQQRAVMGDTRFVLSKFSPAESQIIDSLRPYVRQLIDNFTVGRLEATTYRYQTDNEDKEKE